MNAVAYMRFSSHGQNEQSIEGQRAVIAEYAKRDGYNIINEYVDRALTGTNDKRPALQKMLHDSAKRQFEYVIVYSLDRFSRNRNEAAINKTRLKKHGVRVISATEAITNDPAGIMVEGVLESMAEYFSAELSMKVKRGIAISIEQCKYLGSGIPLGYVVDENKHYQIDPVNALVVQKCFEMYAAGCSLNQINDALTEQYGKKFFSNHYNSLNRMLDNLNYVGVYTRGGVQKEGGMPRIVSDELFERVRQMRAKRKKTPASARAYEEYLLTTKLFCGYDREMMVGTSGTSKSGTIYNYYVCKNVIKKTGCKKKKVRKDYIEDFVISKAREQLTDENIAIITEAIKEASKAESNSYIINEIKKKLKQNATAIDNLLNAIENGEHMDLISERLSVKKQEKAELEKSLALEMMENRCLDEIEIKFFLTRLKDGLIDDIIYRRALVNVFVNSIYLFDDHAIIAFNASDQPVKVDYNLIEELEEAIDSGDCECSYTPSHGTARHGTARHQNPHFRPFCHKPVCRMVDFFVCGVQDLTLPLRSFRDFRRLLLCTWNVFFSIRVQLVCGAKYPHCLRASHYPQGARL